MKEGRQESLELEISVDEMSSEDDLSSTNSDLSSEDSESFLEVMDLALAQPASSEEGASESQLQSMLSKDLADEEWQVYIEVLRRHSSLFISDYEHITGVSIIQHHIRLNNGSKAVAQKLRRLGVVQQDALIKEMQKLLRAGFIYPKEDSEWVSPVVVTPKKNGKWRVCVDYKPLNAATKRDHFPLSFQDEILNEVARHERYTVCDVFSNPNSIRGP